MFPIDLSQLRMRTICAVLRMPRDSKNKVNFFSYTRLHKILTVRQNRPILVRAVVVQGEVERFSRKAGKSGEKKMDGRCDCIRRFVLALIVQEVISRVG